MDVLVTCQHEEDPIKIKALAWSQHYTSIFSDAQGQITLELVVVSGRNLNSSKFFMHVLVTCKNEDDRFKNEGARVFTRFLPFKSMGIFPDAQGQLTPQSWVRSGQIKFRIHPRCYRCSRYLQV